MSQRHAGACLERVTDRPLPNRMNTSFSSNSSGETPCVSRARPRESSYQIKKEIDGSDFRSVLLRPLDFRRAPGSLTANAEGAPATTRWVSASCSASGLNEKAGRIGRISAASPSLDPWLATWFVAIFMSRCSTRPKVISISPYGCTKRAPGPWRAGYSTAGTQSPSTKIRRLGADDDRPGLRRARPRERRACARVPGKKPRCFGVRRRLRSCVRRFQRPLRVFLPFSEQTERKTRRV
jgi:hypothetical protein